MNSVNKPKRKTRIERELDEIERVERTYAGLPDHEKISWNIKQSTRSITHALNYIAFLLVVITFLLAIIASSVSPEWWKPPFW